MKSKLFRVIAGLLMILVFVAMAAAGCASALGNTYQKPGEKAGKGLKYYESHYNQDK